MCTMTATVAKKKQTSEPIEIAKERTEATTGLWVDSSRLPTTLANRGSSKHSFLRTLQSEIRAQNRLLGLADIALGNAKGTPVIEQRKKDRKLKTVERKSAR